MGNIQTSRLNYNGHVITDKGDMLSLTDMWKAAGEPEGKRPANWARKEGEPFIEAVGMSLNVPHGHIMKTQRGKGGATLAHWQVGLAYAKYLDHGFHMWCNTQVRAVMEGKVAATASGLTDYDKQIIGNMIKNCTGVVMKEQFGAMVAQLLPSAVQGYIAEHSLLLRHGVTAKRIWDDFNLPQRLRGSTVWLGNRLAEMGCCIDGGMKADRGNSSIRLFDPDKARICMKNGLHHKARVYSSEKMGQGKLRLVSSSSEIQHTA